ncbi:MAG: hypothetical protein WCP11_03605 [Candidatus Saccharibacteria bacterium]
MINKKLIKAIGDKQMDRKDFLKFSGLVVASAVGLKTVASLLVKTNNSQIAKSGNGKQVASGFGSGKYGG